MQNERLTKWASKTDTVDSNATYSYSFSFTGII